MKRWIKIIVALKLGMPGVSVAQTLAVKFKKVFHVEHLYFARYENELSSTFEISALTGADWPKIKRWFKAHTPVAGIKIELRGTGSMAHALAFEAVMTLPPEDPKKAADDPLHDVIHWMCNMRGLDYMREVRFYGRAIVYFSDMLATKGSEAMMALRKRQLNDLAQCRKRSDSPGSSAAPKTPKSVPSGARKSRAA
jgi:hypothetical protein